jgi:hypothetical protein
VARSTDSSRAVGIERQPGLSVLTFFSPILSLDVLATAIEIARRLACLDPTRRRLWRALRGPGFIDRFHAFVVHKL